MNYLRIKFLLFSIIYCISLNAQYYSTGQDAFSIKWRQIKTDHFQVIYPKQYEENGQELARKLEAVYNYITYSLHAKPRKISVILHSESTVSNGMNGWVPRRLEIWPLADQETYGQDWIEQLAIHEFRHVVQVEKMRQGFGEVLSILFGELSQAATIGLFVPFWYLEGDAVATETALSKSGRGRVPAFTKQLRALVLEKRVKDYDRLILGSYNKFIPNHYVVGYHSVAINRYYKGANYYNKKLDEIANYSWWKTFLSKKGNDLRDRSSIKHVGYAIEKLDSLWQKSRITKEPFQATDILPREDGYCSYLNPVVVSDSIWAIKKSFDDIMSIVAINDNHIVKKIPLGYYAEEHFSANKDFIVWSQRISDIRWEHRSFNDIMLYDIASDKVKRITQKQRLFHPVINKKNEIAAVEVDETGKSQVVILDIEGDEPYVAIESDKQLLMQPAWSRNGDSLIYIKNTSQGKELNLWSKSGVTTIRNASYTEIAHPCFGNNSIYYTAADSGQNVIRRYSLYNRTDAPVLVSKFGADYPEYNFESSKLIYSDYSSDGCKLKLVDRDSLYNISTFIKSPLPIDMPNKLFTQEKGVVDFGVNEDAIFDAKKYSKWDLINLHSWSPFYLSPDFDDARFPSVFLFSQNKLSNTTMYAGLNGGSRNKDERFQVGLSLKMFRPVLNIEYTRGTREWWYAKGDTVTYGEKEYIITSLSSAANEKLKGTIALPLNFSRRHWTRRIVPYVGLEYKFTGNYSVNFVDTVGVRYYSEYDKSEGTFNTAGLLMYNLRQQSLKDLFPRFGQKAQFLFKDHISGNRNYGSMLAGKLDLYFPGVVRGHHFITTIGGQKREMGSNGYGYASFLDLPRGEVDLGSEKLYSLNTDYYCPITYPDLGISWLAYIKRIGVSGFYDYSYASHSNVGVDLWSTGGSVWGDFNFFRYEVPIRLEYRVGYAGYSKQFFSGITFGITMF